MTQPKTASKFTPGPWESRIDLDGPRFIIGIPSMTLAITCGGNDMANARLIATAPEMYELLETIEAWTAGTLKAHPWTEFDKIIGKAHRIKAEIDGEG